MTFTIAIDCMGGDFGPVVTVAAAFAFVKKHADARLILVGQEDKIRPLLRTNSASENDRIRVQHASEIVLMDEAPALSLRNKKDSSLRVALNLVKSGEAAGCISAGNTGALMATSRFVLKTMVGVDIDRPAICGVMPTINGRTYMLDLGANVDCTPEQLLQFGIMGATLVSAVEHTENPSVGLLNIGEEAIKGNEVVKRAAELLKESGLNFIGNVEGDGIYKGVADVIVCDGFVGNVALKTSEGLVKMIGHFLREEFNRNILTKLIGAIAKPLVMDHFKKRVDPRRYNGACLLGLRGLVVKSHGSADEFGFFCALERTAEIARNKVIENIQKRIDLSLSQTQLTKEAV